MNPTAGNPNISEEATDSLAEYTLEGKWDKVIEMYYDMPEAQTAVINNTVGTALHVAVNLDEEHVVHELVNAIITQGLTRGRTAVHQRVKIEALEVGNEHGDTPLHVAAARGFANICKWIIGMNKERYYLASRKNKHGETPLFQAAINWNKTTFAYLSNISGHNAPLQDLVRNNGDTILHCAIRRQYFDLAIIIMHYYDFLNTHLDKEGFTPLKVLATTPSAFRSGIKLSWWKRILFDSILVEPLNAEREMLACLAKMEEHSNEVNYPKNYATLHNFFAMMIGKILWKKNQHDTENPSINKRSTIGFRTRQVGFLTPNYESLRQFVRSAYAHILGLWGVELNEVRKAKKRHEWSGQLLKAIMRRPYAAFTGGAGVPTDIEVDTAMYSVYSQFKQGETSEMGWLGEDKEPEADEQKPSISSSDKTQKETEQLADEKGIDKKETAFLVAARNGIVEMVIEILNKIPSVIYNFNSREENVLLVAVMNRQPLVIESLKMKMQSKPEVWQAMILAVNKDGQTMLHLAAYALEDDKPWQLSGSALQMTWDVNWFQYIKGQVPKDFYFRRDVNGKTAEEIFKETHIDLRKESGEWLKDTCDSCSVVAALVASVSYATVSSIPGGTDEKGMPHLEGKPAFGAFSIASLIGLCLSITGLLMFLNTRSSRKKAKDFSRDLPFKLLLGLTSLLLSIFAMLVSFCTGHSFQFSHKYQKVIFPVYVAISFPAFFYAASQLPLFFDLLAAVFVKVPKTNDEGDSLL